MERIFLIFLFFVVQTTFAQPFSNPGDSLYHIFEKAVSDEERFNTLLKLSDYYLSRDAHKTLRHANEAIEIAKANKSDMAIAVGQFKLGNAYFVNGFLENAVDAYYSSLRISVPERDYMLIIGLMSNISGVKIKLEDYEGALEIANEALSYFEQHSDKLEAINKNYDHIYSIYNNLGIIYRNLGQYDMALKYLTDALELALNSDVGMLQLANIHSTLSACYIDKALHDQAYTHLAEALALRTENNDITGIIKSYRMHASYYKSIGDTAKSKSFLYKGLNLAQQHRYDFQIWEITAALYELYQDDANADSTLKYLKISKQLEEKTVSQNLKEQLVKHEIEHQLFNTQLQAELLHKKNLSKWLMLLGAFVIGLIFIIYFFVRTKTKLKIIQLENQRQNKVIENALLQKELLEKQLEIGSQSLTDNMRFQYQKNELLTKIINKLIAYSKNLNPEQQEAINAVVRKLEYASEDYTWEEFERIFGDVNKDFYKKLNDRFPDLSPNERRLCAFIYLGMEKKEICELTRKSAESIEVAMMRLKRKVSPEKEHEDLHHFLMNL